MSGYIYNNNIKFKSYGIFMVHYHRYSSPDRSVKDVVGIVGCFVRCREDGGMCPSAAGRITGM